MRVLMGFALWGLAEIAAFVVVGQWIGVLGVVALVLGTGLAGGAVLRRQGMQALGQMRGQVMVLRRDSLSGLADGGLLAVGGILLILPGLIADLVGLALLLPFVRHVILRWVAARFAPAVDEGVIDATAVEVEAPRLPSGWTRE